jgi:SAM-dependent methyltransferase
MPIPDIQTFFKYGLDRDIPRLAQPPTQMLKGAAITHPSVELGPGRRKKIPTDHKLQLPEWDARYGMRGGGGSTFVQPHGDCLPFDDSSIGEYHAYQFMEHLDGETAVRLLRAMERTLVPGGVINLVMPYYNSAHMAQALDHKSSWSEETWNWLFGNEYYDDHEGKGWNLKVHCCFIMGIVERNLDLFTQLVKGPAR